MRVGVAIFTGVVAFAPSLLYFVVSRANVTWLLVLEWAIPFGLWLLAWRSGPRRAVLLPLPIAVFMAAVVAFPVPSGFTWTRLAGIALALAVTAAAMSGLKWTLAWSAYAVTLLTVDYLRSVPHAGHLSSSTLDVASTVLGILVIPAAMAVVSRQWNNACEEADAASEASRQREAQALAAERAEAAREAVDRRIHETVLNTLATIARARTSSKAARIQCAEDLRALDSLEAAAPRSVQGLLARALERHPVPTPTVTVVAGDVAFQDDDLASVAFVALGEVLRNVNRHARASRTVIRVRVPRDHVTFTIADDGVGMNDTALRRFGMRRALIESVESSGGSVEVHSEPGAGTTVKITMPLAKRRSVRPPSATSSIDVLLRPASVRVAMASVIVIGLMLLVPTAQVFTNPILLGASYLAFACVVIAVTLRWQVRGIATLAWVSLGVMVATQAIAGWGVQGCVSAGGLHQVVFTTAAAMLLPPLALRRRPWTFAMVALVVLSTVLTPWVLPQDCRIEALVPAIETSLWVVALVGIISVLSRAFDRSSLALAVRWQEIADADARRYAIHAADQRWRSVDSRTRDLLVSVADGTSSPDEPGVRSAAMRLEARIRSLLETSKIRSPGLRACLEDVVEETTSARVSATVVVVSDEASGEVDPRLHAAMLEVARNSAKSGMHLTVLDGELLVSADREALAAADFGDLGETEDPDTAVAVVRWELTPGPV